MFNRFVVAYVVQFICGSLESRLGEDSRPLQTYSYYLHSRVGRKSVKLLETCPVIRSAFGKRSADYPVFDVQFIMSPNVPVRAAVDALRRVPTHFKLKSRKRGTEHEIFAKHVFISFVRQHSDPLQLPPFHVPRPRWDRNTSVRLFSFCDRFQNPPTSCRASVLKREACMCNGAGG